MSIPRIPRPRLTYANVASTLALALALSMGGAYAADQIGSSQIKKNAVKSKHIANGQVKTADVRDGAVTGAKLRNGAVTSAKVLDRTLEGRDFAPRADGVAMAGVTATGIGGGVGSSFNRVGGGITIVNSAAGTYDVTIPGANFANFQQTVSSVSGTFQRYCYVNTAEGTAIQIRCRDFANTLVNSAFTLVVFKDRVAGVSPRAMSKKRAADAP